MLRSEANEETLDSNEVLKIGGRVCVPKVGELVSLMSEEAHCSRYFISPRAATIYDDLSQHY